MIDLSARYVYEIYRQKSVSAAAQKLFLSQPALSTALKKAEKELGAPIFNRKTLPFTLTPEGKVYIETVERMLQLEAETADRIRDIQEVQGGTLTIATASHLSYFAIPRILEVYHRNYPQVDINIVMAGSGKLYELLEKGEADLIFTFNDRLPIGCIDVPLFNTRSVVVLSSRNPVPDRLRRFAVTHEELKNGSYPAEKRITDMTLFDGIEFIYSLPNTHVHKKRKLLFGNPDIKPYITANANRLELNYNLTRAGFGALLTTDADVAEMPADPTCLYFILGPSTEEQFSIVYPEEKQTPILENFISTARKIYKE